MAGKLCQGGPRNNIGAARLSGSKAYCEGMLWRSKGTALEQPQTDNPHESGSEDAVAWSNGWTVANDNAGGEVPAANVGCCAPVGVVPI